MNRGIKLESLPKKMSIPLFGLCDLIREPEMIDLGKLLMLLLMVGEPNIVLLVVRGI